MAALARRRAVGPAMAPTTLSAGTRVWLGEQFLEAKVGAVHGPYARTHVRTWESCPIRQSRVDEWEVVNVELTGDTRTDTPGSD